MRPFPSRPGVALVFAALLSSGCYTYRQVDAPPPGATVRVRVPVASPLASPNAAPRTESIEGDVVSFDGSLVLAVRNRREYGAFREVVDYDTLRIGPDQVSSVEVREFSRGRSVGLGLVVAAGAAALAVAGFSGGGDEPDPPPPPPAPAIVITRSAFSAVWGLLRGR